MMRRDQLVAVVNLLQDPQRRLAAGRAGGSVMISSEQASRNGDAGASRQGSRRRVVILGGGFAGLYAARRLQRTLAYRRDLEVVLISRENYVEW